jgi:hypothetical protein
MPGGVDKVGIMGLCIGGEVGVEKQGQEHAGGRTCFGAELQRRGSFLWRAVGSNTFNHKLMIKIAQYGPVRLDFYTSRQAFLQR